MKYWPAIFRKQKAMCFLCLIWMCDMRHSMDAGDEISISIHPFFSLLTKICHIFVFLIGCTLCITYLDTSSKELPHLLIWLDHAKSYCTYSYVFVYASSYYLVFTVDKCQWHVTEYRIKKKNKRIDLFICLPKSWTPLPFH